MSKNNRFLAFKSAFMLGKDNKDLRKNLKKDEINKAIKEAEIGLRNKKYKIKDF